jgi:hypothetical protein
MVRNKVALKLQEILKELGIERLARVMLPTG